MCNFLHLPLFRSNHPQMFFKIGALKNFTITLGKQLWWSLYILMLVISFLGLSFLWELLLFEIINWFVKCSIIPSLHSFLAVYFYFSIYISHSSWDLFDIFCYLKLATMVSSIFDKFYSNVARNISNAFISSAVN